jgi:hypothetical protein
LGIGTYIDAHLAIGRTISARNALAAIGGNPKFGEQTLLKTENCGHGTTKTTPDPIAKNGIESGSNDSRKDTADQKGIGFAKRFRFEQEHVSIATKKVHPEEYHNDHKVPNGPILGIFLELVPFKKHHPAKNQGQQCGNTD